MSPPARAAQHAPVVSVVVATYDRPRALAAALSSLLAQTMQDWEGIVVGDSCDERTGRVVDQLGDPRLRYVNLARNVGEQSGPNNVGAALARAELIAYLNHDDLWFPDHLATCLEAIRATAADLVFSSNANVVADGAGAHPVVVLDARGRQGRYEPAAVRETVPASTWLVRRALLAELDGWRSAGECRVEPSQDLLFRARRAGARLRSTEAMTVVTFPSGVRLGAYLVDRAEEQERWLARLGEPSARAELLAAASASAAAERRKASPLPTRAWSAALELAARSGLDARALDFGVRRGFRKGQYLGELRRRRGLASLDARGSGDHLARVWHRQARASGPVPLGRTLTFAPGGDGALLLAGGWSHLEEWGVWNDGTAASLVVEVPAGLPADGFLHVDLAVRVNTSVAGGVQRVSLIWAGGSERWEIGEPGPVVRRLDIRPAGRRFVVLELELPDAGPVGDDRRELALGLVSLTATLA